jgi:hypothetical protein
MMEAPDAPFGRCDTTLLRLLLLDTQLFTHTNMYVSCASNLSKSTTVAL